MRLVGNGRQWSAEVEQNVDSTPDGHAPGRPRTPLLIGAVFVLLGGMFIGALGTTVMLRTSMGSAGDQKVRHAIALHALLDAPGGLAAPADTARRSADAFAHSFVIGAAALDSTASVEDRQRMIDIAGWMVDTDALGGRQDAVSRWAMIAADCVVTHGDAPRTAANCVRDRMPHDVPVPAHARD